MKDLYKKATRLSEEGKGDLRWCILLSIHILIVINYPQPPVALSLSRDIDMP